MLKNQMMMYHSKLLVLLYYTTDRSITLSNINCWFDRPFWLDLAVASIDTRTV
jgi:hypothetical protein